MSKRTWIVAGTVVVLALVLVGACNPNPQPEALTPIPTLAPAEPVTLISELQTPQQPGGLAPESAVTEEPSPSEPAEAGDAVKGDEVYIANCIPCHGPDAAGGPVGPTLVTAEIAAQEDDYYREVIGNGREGTAMPAWGDQLSAQDIENLIAYLRSKQ
ncbi:c-type cytochrome [Chloroflexota bacterium]